MVNRKLLLIEENPKDEALLHYELKKCNIVNDVVVVRNGVEALDYLFARGMYEGRDLQDMPQFVLLDLKSPEIDGLQVLQRMRADERTKRLPTVVFTTSSEEEDLIKSWNLGVNSFIRKPVVFERFVEATTQVGMHWLVLNQVAKVLIVDGHEVVRHGVKKILGEQPGTTTFGEAGTIAEALKLVCEQDWDVIVLEPAMGGGSGLDVLKEFKRIRPHLPVLILSMHSEEHYAQRAFEAGAAGYITKESPRAELVKAVNKVIEGGKYVSPALAERLVFDMNSAVSARSIHKTLSKREFEVMCLIASGKKVGEIAEILSLSDRTISTYRARILEKMGMKTNSELTRYAIKNKLVD